MYDTYIEGVFSRERAIGQDDYCLFQLTSDGLRQFVSCLRINLSNHDSFIIYIGQGCICLRITAEECFSAELLNDGIILLQSDRDNLDILVSKLDNMTLYEQSIDSCSHIHLDTLFTVPAKSCSDIVIQLSEQKAK